MRMLLSLTGQVSQPDLPEVVAARAAWLAQAATDAFEALQAPDPDLDAERAVMAGHRREE
jgi:hypothetical protein